ncbi:FtsW/RodA/SpoVE family cell cycle protein [Anaerostipes sp.]|uniref:FtsW/RodA/SpoVE family cell cycle protein n=1 Tax=Anaerostipes sp. TaxID=1872530 RepID=UPI0025C5A4BC|nr:FtsW/RodA/SpoVE family cell cycle protein [Anaerostipes sp.]MBS7008155.1 FtsW/RodA/SpoVE family cell cycle protein [Anaerostipes sp.]
MVQIIAVVAKYLILIMCLVYTFSCFTMFRPKNKKRQEELLDNQVIYMFVFLFLCNLVLFLRTLELKVLIFFAAQIVFFEIVMILYPKIYKRSSRLLINNMCFLLGTGFVILTRLSFELAMKQFAIVAIGVLVTGLIPLMMHKLSFWNKLGWVYAIGGFALLSSVFVFGVMKNGAYNWVQFGSLAFQPSEFVKIIFVFFAAAMLSKAKEFKDLVKITVIAALYVLVLVVEKDLGGALLYFMIYLMMLYVATAKPSYLLGGLGGGALAAVVAYHLFSHVQVRVAVWKDPFSMIEGRGAQVCQSLFAIGTGSWFGMGLTQGRPFDIPVRESDFIFSVISEEFGVIFGICLIFVLISCFILFMDISTRSRTLFNKLLCLGFGICFIFQVFLSIGGVTKFIPSTGVTIPLVSYGGTSVLSTLIILSVIQGLHMLADSEEEENENIQTKKESGNGDTKEISLPKNRTKRGKKEKARQ